ncbi:MAG: RagB/SusD family nutrient uptake outer membrane protein [Bacteroidota bacterium]|nr:RagB/SusD family nutrient uptake outer membrane protein [Bacteroidota bacterium]
MNNKIILGIFSLAVLLVTSCSDKFLEDVKSYDKYDESIFTNETETGWYIDRMYFDAFSGYKRPDWTVIGLFNDDRSRSTEEFGGTVKNWTNPNMTLTNASDCPTYYGTSLPASAGNTPYTRIRYYNFLIEKIKEKGQSLSKTFRDRARGQMLFLRAWQYYDLLRTYGGVPIVTSVQTASTTDDVADLPRASSTEVVARITADLDTAFALLPDKWGASDYGRFTRGAALAMKSRVLLTFASPLFNKDWDNSNNQRWQDALNAAKAAVTQLTTDGYGLYGSTSKEWANMFLVDNSFCKEAIIVQLCSPNTTSAVNNGWESAIRLSSQKGSGGVAAPKEMIDLFPMANGSRPTVANGYDDTKFFLNRDPRFYRTFAFSGCKWANKSSSTATVWAYRYLKTDNKTYVYPDGNQITSPAFVKKMSSPTADDSSYGYSGTDIFEYRYAELILNLAECYAATGDLTNCLEQLKLIRKRVGIQAGTLGDYGITKGTGAFADKYAAVEACLYERRVELAYEGKRFWDAQRWLLFDGVSYVSTSVNTCAKLGIAPINGTCRTGNYWQAKTNTNSDPIPAATKSTIVIDPDASDFNTQLNSLATVFDTYLKRVPTDKAMDLVNGAAVNINFRNNYYIFGLPSGLLSNNPWLIQTKGWNDIYGTTGTYDYQP